MAAADAAPPYLPLLTSASIDAAEAVMRDAIAARGVSRVPASTPLVLAVCVRHDLGMSKGKAAAQCAHGALGSYKIAQRVTPELVDAWESRAPRVVTLALRDEGEMDSVASAALALALPFYVIEDAGRTEVASGTRTVLGLGPLQSSDLEALVRAFSLETVAAAAKRAAAAAAGGGAGTPAGAASAIDPSTTTLPLAVSAAAIEAAASAAEAGATASSAPAVAPAVAQGDGGVALAAAALSAVVVSEQGMRAAAGGSSALAAAESAALLIGSADALLESASAPPPPRLYALTPADILRATADEESSSVDSALLPPEVDLKMIFCVNEKAPSSHEAVWSACSLAVVAAYRLAAACARDYVDAWQFRGCAKIALKVPNETRLLLIAETVRAAGLPCVVQEAERGGAGGGTIAAVLCIGPAPVAALDAITGRSGKFALGLLR